MAFKTIDEYQKEIHLLEGEKSELERDISWLASNKINRLAVVNGEIERRQLYIKKIVEAKANET